MKKKITLAMAIMFLALKNPAQSMTLDQLDNLLPNFMIHNLRAGQQFTQLLNDAVALRVDCAKKNNDGKPEAYNFNIKSYIPLAESEKLFNEAKDCTSDVATKYQKIAEFCYSLMQTQAFEKGASSYAEWFLKSLCAIKNLNYPFQNSLLFKTFLERSKDDFIQFFLTGDLHEVSAYHAFVKNSGRLVETTQEHALLIPELRIYEGSNLKFGRYGKPQDGGYTVEQNSCDAADVIMGYGIADDCSFEEDFAMKQNKEAHLFDGGIDGIDSKDPRLHFHKENIATDLFLYDRTKSSGINLTFKEQVEKHGLQDKKIFIKMDIEGAEYPAIPQILEYEKQITGIVIEVHFAQSGQPAQALKLFQQLNQYFYLVHVHGNNLTPSYFALDKGKNIIPNVIELTYINKALLENPVLSTDQSFPKSFDKANHPMIPECMFNLN